MIPKPKRKLQFGYVDMFMYSRVHKICEVYFKNSRSDSLVVARLDTASIAVSSNPIDRVLNRGHH